MSLALAALLSLVLFSQEMGPPGVSMAERVSASAESAGPEGCDRALADAEELNAEALFTGAVICGLSDREDDEIFLLLAGQARASADMLLTLPESLPGAGEDGVVILSNVPAPPFGVIDLYGFIYAYAGGAGPTEFYRDVDRTNRLFARLDVWEPTRPPGYNPGWEGSRVADEAEYAESVRILKAERRAQILRLAHLSRDDAYYALEQELEALRASNGNRFVDGTPAHQRHQELLSAQAELAARISPEE